MLCPCAVVMYLEHLICEVLHAALLSDRAAFGS